MITSLGAALEVLRPPVKVIQKQVRLPPDGKQKRKTMFEISATLPARVIDATADESSSLNPAEAQSSEEDVLFEGDLEGMREDLLGESDPEDAVEGDDDEEYVQKSAGNPNKRRRA